MVIGFPYPNRLFLGLSDAVAPSRPHAAVGVFDFRDFPSTTLHLPSKKLPIGLRAPPQLTESSNALGPGISRGLEQFFCKS